MTRDLDGEVLRGQGLPLHRARVIELGCGTGKNTRYLAAHATSVLALDFSPGMLAHARAAVRDPHVTFREHDVCDPWPVANHAVDVVVGNLVLEHVQDVAVVFREMARVLVPGGVAYLCELHPFRQARGGQAHFTDPSSGETVHVPAFVHTVPEYVNAGVAAGLRVVQLGDWLEDDAPPGALPRLLSMRFARPEEAGAAD